MLVIVEKGIRGGIFHASHQYVKAINKYMKNYDRNKESSYLRFWDEIICMDWQCNKSELSVVLLG